MALSLTLSVLDGEYAVCQLPEAELSGGSLPGWATSGPLWSVTRAPGEVSIVCAESGVPPEVRCTPGWAALRLHGPFDFGETGILTAVLEPLRDAGVGIFALSTFDTDYVLVQREQLPAALDALRAAGLTVE